MYVMKKTWKWLSIGIATIIGYMIASRKLEENRDFH